MAISKDKKKDILNELIDDFSSSKSIVFATNEGLSVDDISKFRQELKEKKAKFKIAKKTLIKLAIKKNNLPEVSTDILEGPIGVIFAFEDELVSAQASCKAEKDLQKLKVKGGIFFEEICSKEKIVQLSKIPSKEELLAKFIGCSQAPLNRFVSIGQSLIYSFVRTCSEIVKQKS